MADYRVDSRNETNATSKAMADIIYAVSASWSASIYFGLMKCLIRCMSFFILVIFLVVLIVVLVGM